MTKGFISQTHLITPPEGNGAPVRIGSRWRHSVDGKYFGTLDLRLRMLPANQNNAFQDDAICCPLLLKLVHGIWDKLQASESTDTTELATKVILVPSGSGGFVCRSDIIHLRLVNSQFVERVIAFADCNKQLFDLSPGFDGSDCLKAWLHGSPGALLLRQPINEEELLNDFTARLSFDWLLPTKPTARRVAVISGRPFPDRKRKMFNAQGYFAAAHALGISLVVVDNPGHWLQDGAYRDLCEEFVPMDMDLNRLIDLPQRLFDALKDKHLDGIVTFWDAYVIQTAEAAELLGLPTESPTALRQAHLKHEMRRLLNPPNFQAITVDSLERLQDPSFASTLANLRYPLVVKPCRGITSENVKKVADERGMREAVRMAFRDGFPNPAIALVLIETYIDGPEFDANFMLWDGEVRFLEVTDNFPCPADAADATVADPFRETVQISNSALPPSEIEAIRSSFHQIILKLGFRSGVFHVEGRMRNSSVKYRDPQGDGILDLLLDDEKCGTCDSACRPEPFLIEINVRPPGTGGTWATLFAYGVDQGALHFLRALNDAERFAALSHPYDFSSGRVGGGGGAQFWTAQCLVPIHRNNIRVPDDLWERVYQEFPQVETHVLRAEMYAEPGTIVSMNRSVGWIGYVLLYSRVSRRHVLELYHRLARTCIKVLDEE